MRSLPLLVVAALVAMPCAHAESSVEASGRAGIVSNYVFEGVSQSWNRPAAQAEVELEHTSGAYAGAFASTISPRQYPGGAVEIESWLGYGREWGKRTSVGVELAYYGFPGANFSHADCRPRIPCPDQSFNTAEVRINGRWDWLTMQASYSLTDYFGASAATGFAGSTRGTTRLEAGVDHPISADEAWSVAALVGYTRYGSAFVQPVLPGVDGNGPDYRVELRRRASVPFGNAEFSIGIAGTSRGVTSRSLTDTSQTRLGGPQPYVGFFLTF